MRKLTLLALLLLGGCQGSFGVGGITLDQVRQMSTVGLQIAHTKAVTSGDKAGAACWEALMPIPSPQGSTIDIPVAIEDGRLFAMALHGPCSGIAQPIISFVTGF